MSLSVFSMLRAASLLLFTVFSAAEAVRNDQLQQFQLLINPGLSQPATDQSFDDCINRCREAANCSAVSYNPSSHACVQSFCGSLHLTKNNGWNSFLLYSPPVESYHYTAPQYEWMLTDTCGTKSTGMLTNAPALSPSVSGISYSESPTSLIGKTIRMNGASSTYVVSSGSAAFNLSQIFLNGFTCSAWMKYAAIDENAICEFGYWSGSQWTYGPHFWLFGGDLFFNLAIFNVVPVNYGVAYKPPINTWVHIAVTYNPSAKTITWYLNGSVFTSITLNTVLAKVNTPIFYFVSGGRPSANNYGFNGQIYCLRMHLQLLSASDIWANAQACNGRVRFT